MNVAANQSRYIALAVPEIHRPTIAIDVLGGGCEPAIFGKRL